MLYKRDTYIIVTVDTANIKIGNEDTMVEFSDNRGDSQGFGTSFISTVDEGKNVIWIGISKNSNTQNTDVVEIKKIERKLNSGAELLRKNIYEDNDDGVVAGKIRDKNNEEDNKNESYSITFEVNGTEYTIDPQLRMI